jgi:Tol biopolymer transport system component
MTGKDSGLTPPTETADRRLGSWKEIAAYLGRGVRSVQRWEQEEGLPVHRLSHQKRGSVYAFKNELDAWWESRRISLSTQEPEVPGVAGPGEPGQSRGPISWKALILLGAAAVAAVGLYFATRTAAKRGPTLRQVTRIGTVRQVGCSLSRDGSIVAFASDAAEEGNLDIWVQQIDGGQARRLTHDPEADTDPAMSPDGTKVLFASHRASGSGIYQVSTAGGDERLLIPGGEEPRYSQDGMWIAYLSEEEPRRLYVADYKGAKVREIPTGLARFDHPIWSPDGKYLMVNGGRDASDGDWWVIPTGGGEPINTLILHDLGSRLVSSLRLYFHAQAWLPGDRILFAGDQAVDWYIWQIRLSAGTFHLSGRPEQITGVMSAADVSFSTAGNHLALVTGVPDYQLWRLPAETDRGQMAGLPRRITQEGPSFIPSLSADGTVLAYATARRGRGTLDIYTRNLETGEEKVIASAPQLEQYATLSRDGSNIAYGMVVPDSRRPIYVHDLTSHSTRKLCDDCEGRPSDWSQDGTKLILSMPGKGIGILDVNTLERSVILPGGTSGMLSPDGRWLAASVGSVQVGGRIFIVPYRGSAAVPEPEWMSVGDPGAERLFGSWSPDGRLLYFISTSFFNQAHPTLEAQRFDPQSGKLVERPIVVYRFGEPFLPLLGLPLGNRIAISPDQIILASGGWKGDVWMTDVTLPK